MDKQNKIIVVIGERQLGMSFVGFYLASQIDGALAAEASAYTLSSMLQRIKRPDLLVGKAQLNEEVSPCSRN
jgi:hypothetical protein